MQGRVKSGGSRLVTYKLDKDPNDDNKFSFGHS
jgi:hypothetical protein